jgi:hypothetical protein
MKLYFLQLTLTKNAVMMVYSEKYTTKYPTQLPTTPSAEYELVNMRGMNS